MAFARDVYTATSGQTDFTISFTYLADGHIVVTQNGTTLVNPDDYTLPNATTVRLVSGATLDDVIVITRSSSQSTRLTDYTAGVLTEADLDNDSLQAFYMAQEAIDQTGLALKKDSSEIWDATSIRIQNVATPSGSNDAVNKTYADAISAAAGNVPTPGNPGEDNYLLQASAGSFSWQSPTDVRADLSLTTIATADIDDNAVTLAKLEDGTSGDILYYGAAGAPARLAKGSNDEVLTLASGLPSWAALPTSVPVGAVTAYLSATIPSGWLELDGTTIGSASSGADNASADYETLFLLLYDSMTDAVSPVFDSSGTPTTRVGEGTAATAWGNNVRLTLPDATGRAIFGLEASATRISGNYGNINGATMGGSGGSEKHLLTTAEMPAHTHSETTVGATDVTNQTSGISVVTGSAGSTTGSAGGGGNHNNMPPAIIMVWMVKY